jgi:hypothetical protein
MGNEQLSGHGLSERLLSLRHLAAMHFRKEQWRYLGEVTGCHDLIRQHERLGVVHWGDNDYDACVLQILTAVVERCPDALPVIERYAEELCAGLDEDALSRATLTRL